MLVRFTGFFVAFWITAVMFKANDVLRKQTALKVTASPLAFPVIKASGSSLSLPALVCDSIRRILSFALHLSLLGFSFWYHNIPWLLCNVAMV